MKLALILSVVLLAACSSTPTRMMYPEPGMTTDFVAEHWGAPSDTSYRDGPLGRSATWWWVRGPNVLAMHFRLDGEQWVLTSWDYSGRNR